MGRRLAIGLVIALLSACSARRPSTVELPACEGASLPHFEFQLDEGARLLDGSRSPSRETRFVAQVIVDADGRPDSASVKVFDRTRWETGPSGVQSAVEVSDAPLVERARRRVAPLRYAPGVKSGCRVSQWVSVSLPDETAPE